MDRLLIVALVALAVALAIGLGRLAATRRLSGLRRQSPDRLWRLLGEVPDGRKTVVAFSTPGCAVCRTAQYPALAALERATAGDVRVISVDATERPDVAAAFGVLTVPCTVVLGAGGDVLAANQGFARTERLTAQLGLA